jgi:putative YphP/YqiW family bacilliredoxin
MKNDLVQVGFEELTTPEEVDEAIRGEEGTTLLVVNSVCGCAAGNARPAVKAAVVQQGKTPTRMVTVFAGVDTAATAQARKYLQPYPPSSPAIALFKEGKLVHFIERHHIEGRPAHMIADNLVAAFEAYC